MSLIFFDHSNIIKFNWKKCRQFTSNFIHWTSISLISSFIISIPLFNPLTDGRSSLPMRSQKIIAIDTFSTMNKQPIIRRWSLAFENWIPRKSLVFRRLKIFSQHWLNLSFSLRTTNFVSTLRHVSISMTTINNGNPMEWESDRKPTFFKRIASPHTPNANESFINVLRVRKPSPSPSRFFYRRIYRTLVVFSYENLFVTSRWNQSQFSSVCNSWDMSQLSDMLIRRSSDVWTFSSKIFMRCKYYWINLSDEPEHIQL